MKKNPCEGCSKCCEYVCLEIDAPEDKADYDDIRWYLLHKNVRVFIDHDDSWNLEFLTPCEKLDKDGNCSEYDIRPEICRKHSFEDCEKYGEDEPYKILFEHIEEFNKWVDNGCKIPE